MSYTIYNDDAFSIIPTLENNSIDCIITSPPYWNLRDYGHVGQIGMEKTPLLYVEKIVNILRLCRQKLKDSGTLWLNLGDTYVGGKGKSGAQSPERQLIRSQLKQSISRSYQCIGGKSLTRPSDDMKTMRSVNLKPKDLVGIPWRVAFALQEDGWFLRNDIIWDKPNGMPESVTDRCTKSHEYIFLLTKSKKYYFDYKSIQETCLSTGTKISWEERKKKGEDIRQVFKGSRGIRFGIQPNNKKNKRSVWHVPTNHYSGGHIATFPPDLIIPCVLAGCPPRGVVLDPFAGAGTTGAVCELYDRHSILIEINPEYTTLIPSRIDQIVSKRHR